MPVPPKGMLAPRMDLLKPRISTAENGASAISVVTDGKYFLRDRFKHFTIYALCSRTPLPLLRKDFMIAESQIYQARANGADAVFLSRRLSPMMLYLPTCTPLPSNWDSRLWLKSIMKPRLDRALRLHDVRLIGINNRDLATFNVSLSTTERLRPMIPPV